MARIDLDKKRVTAWPWIIGLLIVIALGWGVSVLLSPDETEEPQVAVPVEETTSTPAAIPGPADEYSDTDPARPVAEIAPLGEEDVGEILSVEGEVVATGNTGFWVLSGKDVLRVDSDRRVRKGDTISVQGTIQSADRPERTDAIVSDVLSRHPESDQWQIARVIKLVEG